MGTQKEEQLRASRQKDAPGRGNSTGEGREGREELPYILAPTCLSRLIIPYSSYWPWFLIHWTQLCTFTFLLLSLRFLFLPPGELLFILQSPAPTSPHLWCPSGHRNVEEAVSSSSVLPPALILPQSTHFSPLNSRVFNLIFDAVYLLSFFFKLIDKSS